MRIFIFILSALFITGCGGQLGIDRNVNGNFIDSYTGSAKVLEVQDTYAKIWWEKPGASTTVSGFNIVDEDGNVLATPSATANTITLTGLTALTEYNLSIQVLDGAGSIYENSPSVSFTTITVQVHTLTVDNNNMVAMENYPVRSFQTVTSSDPLMPVTYAISGNPAFVTIDTTTGLITVNATTGDDALSPYPPITVDVDNGLATDSKTFTLYVEDEDGTSTRRALSPAAYNPGVSDTSFGYVEYLPITYTDPTYSTLDDHCGIIYLGGSTTAGDGTIGDGTVGPGGLNNVVNEDVSNLPALIEDSLERFPCLVFSPQTVGGNWSIPDTNEFVNFILDNYRVNPKRLSLVGSALGGYTAMEYATYYANNLGAISAHYPIPPTAPVDESDFYNLGILNFWHFTDDLHSSYTNIIAAIDAITDYISGSATVEQTPTVIMNSSYTAGTDWSHVDAAIYANTTNRGLSTSTISAGAISYAAFASTPFQSWIMNIYQNNGVELLDFQTIPSAITNGAKTIDVSVTVLPLLNPVDSVYIDLSSIGGSTEVEMTKTEEFTYTVSASINATTGHHTLPLKVADSNGGFAYLFPSTIVSADSASIVRTVNINFNDRSLPSATSTWTEVELDTFGEINKSLYSDPLTDSSNRSTDIRVLFQSNMVAQEGVDGYQPGSGMAIDSVLLGYLWNNDENAPFEFDLAFLPQHYTYDITFYSAHASDGNDYETDFTIGGVTKTVDSDDNGTTIVFTGITPDSSGRIRIEMAKTAAADFGCINGMKIEIKD